jgi:hypothetical protein
MQLPAGTIVPSPDACLFRLYVDRRRMGHWITLEDATRHDRAPVTP